VEGRGRGMGRKENGRVEGGGKGEERRKGGK